jgi:hypothetical protein
MTFCDFKKKRQKRTGIAEFPWLSFLGIDDKAVLRPSKGSQKLLFIREVHRDQQSAAYRRRR